MEHFPCPSGVKVEDSVTLKLCSTNYFLWKEQMLKFLASHNLSGFVSIDSTYNRPTNPDSPLDSWELEHKRWEEEEKDRESNLREDRGREDMWDQQARKRQEEEWEQMGREVAHWAGEGEWERERERWEAEWKREHQEAESKRENVKREREKKKRERQERLKAELEAAKLKYSQWKRSDEQVRNWILQTVTKEIELQVMHLRTARDVWIKIKVLLAQPFQLSHLEEIDWTDKKRGQTVSKYVVLHKAALTANWADAAKFLDETPGAAFEPITWCSETALIVAIRSAKRNYFVEKLMLRMLRESEKAKVPQQQLLAETDISGATALHAAVGGGNMVAAKFLVVINPELANIKDKHGTLAVHVAAGLGNRDMVDLLLDHSTNLFESDSGHKLLHSLASSELYDIALTFLQKNPRLASKEPSPLVVMAQKRTSFRSGSKLNCMERLIYSGIPSQKEDISNHPQERDIENPTSCVISALIYVRQTLNALFWDVAEKLVPPIKSVRETKLIHHQALALVKCLCEEVVKDGLVNAAEIFTGPLRIATCVGIHEIVEEILLTFPSAIHMRSEKDQSLFHLAIVHRRENVFNLIYQMEEDPRAFLSMPDASTRNALHSAGGLGEQQQLSLRASAAGAALQMQRELQWFEEVRKVLLPQAKELMNAEGQTPHEVFTATHKNLVEQGEKWMKETATSCTIAAALITTIVFAAAITVPGGSDNTTGQTSGLPIFRGDLSFTLFLVSDALALFSSSASLLIFLSILTSRYGEQDFLYSLPKRMIFGLVGLFLSIISMMGAFGATLKIVSGEKKMWIIISVAISSCFPVFLFALLQFPLLLLMFKSTYGRGIFKKQSDRILH